MRKCEKNTRVIKQTNNQKKPKKKQQQQQRQKQQNQLKTPERTKTRASLRASPDKPSTRQTPEDNK